jgi:DNA-binding XRE family transcriptional regulator
MRRGKDQPPSDIPADHPIYNRIAVLRAERGLSRRDLAQSLGVNYQTIGYIERGEYSPSLELTFRFSELFGLPIEAIFSRRPFRPLSEEVYNRSHPGRGEESA